MARFEDGDCHFPRPIICWEIPPILLSGNDFQGGTNKPSLVAFLSHLHLHVILKLAKIHPRGSDHMLKATRHVRTNFPGRSGTKTTPGRRGWQSDRSHRPFGRGFSPTLRARYPPPNVPKEGVIHSPTTNCLRLDFLGGRYVGEEESADRSSKKF